MISLFISLYYTCRTLVTLRSFIILPYAIYYAIYTSCKKINVRRIEIINASECYSQVNCYRCYQSPVSKCSLIRCK